MIMMTNTMMNKVARVAVLAMIISLVMVQCARADYVDCQMECLFASFRRVNSICNCEPAVRLHWGKKRAPRTRGRNLPTFRYGKRESPFVNSDFEVDNSRIDALRAMQGLQDSEEFDV